MTDKKPVFIGVIGAGACSGELCETAEAVGRAIAEKGAVLVCGGLGGVMRAAARGAKEKNGLTVGILPGDARDNANEYIDIPIATGIGEARNLLIIKTADAVIALQGEFGTLSEMAFCMKVGKPLVSISAWDVSDKIFRAQSPAEAVEAAVRMARKIK